MKICIIEDDVSVIDILERIIIKENLGTICGKHSENVKVHAILLEEPDIVLIDLLMPKRDGIEIVAEIKKLNPLIKFIMISQVEVKEMIAKAYNAGVDFFVHKPINLVEVRSVIKNVSASIANERKIEAVQSIFTQQKPQLFTVQNDEAEHKEKLQNILNQIGMSGEKGSTDIILIVLYLIKNSQTASGVGIGNLCKISGASAKSTEQRIRRAMEKGLNHIANLGLEDYSNEYFNYYAPRLFHFSEVRNEMMHIKGNGIKGTVNLKKFLDGLVVLTGD